MNTTYMKYKYSFIYRASCKPSPSIQYPLFYRASRKPSPSAQYPLLYRASRKPSPFAQYPLLLLLDNHEFHISIEVIDYAREHGVVMLSFPPHCSHKLQPLDRTVYGPLKKYYNSACESWLLANPGKTMNIYNIPALVAEAFPKALCPSNIT